MKPIFDPDAPLSTVDRLSVESDVAPLVVIIDDDIVLSKKLNAVFSQSGFQVLCASTAEHGMAILTTKDADVVILDVMLPDRLGYEMIGDIRKACDAAIVMLSARGDVEDRITGLHMGADDYVAKPFDSRELLARSMAVMRRGVVPSDHVGTEVPLDFSGWSIDPVSRAVTDHEDRDVKLTSKEFDLLLAFVRNAGTSLTRSWLQFAVNQRDWHPDDRSLDNLVARLRRKLGSDPKLGRAIISERNVGYRFVAIVTPKT